MFYRIFSKNNLTAFALLPLLLIGLRVKLLMNSQVPLTDDVNTPLWTFIYNTLKVNSNLLNITAILLTLLAALGVNRLTNHFAFTQRQTVLSAFFYIVFCSGFIMVQELHPILLFTVFAIISIERLFLAVAAPTPMRHIFEASVWLSFASLFYGKGVWFFPLLLLAMAMMRIANLKSFLAAIIGFALPHLFAATWYLYHDQLAWYGDMILEITFTPIAFFNHNLMSQVYLVFTSVFIVISLLSAIRRLTTIKIISRKYFRFIIWIVFYPIALVFTPYFSFDVLPIVAIGAAILSASMVSFWVKNRLREISILALIIITLTTQWLVG